MKELRFALVGTGFWARFQLAGWRELPGARCVALCNRTREKAERLAAEFGGPAVYTDLETLLRREPVDFVDIVSDVGTHAAFTAIAAAHGRPAICQKPMARTLAEARAMVARSREARAPLYIHENWRWQTPIRALARALASGVIGEPFRARIDMISGFPVFANQPFLAELEQFILADLGSHIFDVARFLFGEVTSLSCRTQRVHAHIKGEDVATVLLETNGGRTTVVCNLAYAGTPLERECFPQTLAFVEGPLGSIELGPDYELRITTRTGTQTTRHPPPIFSWADPDYAVVHASIVACNENLLGALRGEGRAETTAEDNLRTVELVFGAYASAQARSDWRPGADA